MRLEDNLNDSRMIEAAAIVMAAGTFIMVCEF